MPMGHQEVAFSSFEDCSFNGEPGTGFVFNHLLPGEESQCCNPWQTLLLDAWKEGQQGWVMPACLASVAPSA